MNHTKRIYTKPKVGDLGARNGAWENKYRVIAVRDIDPEEHKMLVGKSVQLPDGMWKTEWIPPKEAVEVTFLYAGKSYADGRRYKEVKGLAKPQKALYSLCAEGCHWRTYGSSIALVKRFKPKPRKQRPMRNLKRWMEKRAQIKGMQHVYALLGEFFRATSVHRKAKDKPFFARGPLLDEYNGLRYPRVDAGYASIAHLTNEETVQ